MSTQGFSAHIQIYFGELKERLYIHIYWIGQKVRSVLSKNRRHIFIFTKNFIEQGIHWPNELFGQPNIYTHTYT